MSKRTDKSLFIVSSLPRLYQQLFSGAFSYQQVGNRIIRQIKAAHAFRQVEQVRELASILINIPIREYQLIAQYYLVWCECRETNYQTDILDRIIDQTRIYKTTVLTSRGTFESYKGNIEAAIYFYIEALKTSPTVSEYIDLSRAIAVQKAMEGFHKTAIRDMENLLPIIEHADPLAYYEFLNSYAVELGEVGRIYEARNICNAVLASPFAFAYPEWQQTAQDLRGANRSTVAINSPQYTPSKVLLMPEHESDFAEPAAYTQPARVLDFQKWKKKMARAKEENDKKRRRPTTPKDMFIEIMSVYTSETTTDEQRYKIYEAVMKAMSWPEPPLSDDPQGA